MLVVTRSQKGKMEENNVDTSRRTPEYTIGQEPSESEACEDSNGPDVFVLVGPKRQRFGLHESTLSVSDFFNAALRSDSFKGGRDRIVRLPDIEPPAFKSIVNWIYNLTKYEDLELIEKSKILSLFKTADYLLLDIYKTKVLMDLTYRVSTYLQNTYLKVAMASYKSHMGRQCIVCKAMGPKGAIEIVTAIYEYCHPQEMEYVQRCLIAIAAATEEVKDIEDNEEWDEQLTKIWNIAKNGIENTKNAESAIHFGKLSTVSQSDGRFSANRAYAGGNISGRNGRITSAPKWEE
ncbi:uncharacterized protein DFL_000382 [Arthrobotrys flagrans]|uniref:BTB domain-containing protein n=1 Tax=Arthrobotrys flagrans TaxID=97331 RepID=A0A437AF79_ARTFL|nr:hypothetical protein DFL_000382 [Arthrobotrys flagrans]